VPLTNILNLAAAGIFVVHIAVSLRSNTLKLFSLKRALTKL